MSQKLLTAQIAIVETTQCIEGAAIRDVNFESGNNVSVLRLSDLSDLTLSQFTLATIGDAIVRNADDTIVTVWAEDYQSTAIVVDQDEVLVKISNEGVAEYIQEVQHRVAELNVYDNLRSYFNVGSVNTDGLLTDITLYEVNDVTYIHFKVL